MSQRQSVIDEILKRRVSAIIRTNDQQLAADAMAAAVRGGIRMVEFTLTTPGAYELIAEFAGNADLLVGAGTVLTPDQASKAVAAGARFLVSPICDPEVIQASHTLDAVSIPGTFTATEMQTAHRAGADFVKLFPAPADIAGYVAAMLGPLPHLRIFPTAGVTPQNANDVLLAGAAGVGLVGSLFDRQDMAARNFAAIEARAAAVIRNLPRAS